MPLDEPIEGGHGARESGLKRGPHAVHDFLEVHDEREHREYRLHQQAVLPLTTLTQFEIAWIAFSGMEAGSTQDDHLFCKLSNQPLKGVIRDTLLLDSGVLCSTVVQKSPLIFKPMEK